MAGLLSTESDRSRRTALILVHGRGFKPAKADLQRLWIDALAAGLRRDRPDALAAFGRLATELVYYGGESATVLNGAGRQHDPALDLADLENTLVRLTAIEKTKQFRREHYERLPGKTPLKEFLADIGAPALSLVGLADRAIAHYLPELASYWRADRGGLGAAADRVVDALVRAFERDDDVVLVSHCIGSVLAYDALWALSRGAAGDGRYADKKVKLWLTLGSPLGDESVKRHLRGAGEGNARRYPGNVVNWLNIAAEDDFLCHDRAVANDYRAMLALRLASRIEDASIYNMALRYGRSNPHNVLGYLVHPRVARALAEALGVGSSGSDSSAPTGPDAS